MAIERNGTPTGTLIETHKLVCATGDTNHNKVWIADLYSSDDVHIEFGRIGVTSSKGVHRGVGKSFMEKKMKEKKRGKKNKKTGQYEPYTEIEILDGSGSTDSSSSKVVHASELKSIAKDQIKHSSPETAKLIDWLADVNRHQISDVTGGQVTWNADKGLFATPLGIVPASSISKARTLLNDISDYVVDNDLRSRQFTSLVEQYLTISPHNLGMKWSPETFLPSITQVQRENGVLDALDASYASAITAVPTKGKKQKKVKVPKVFETKLTLVENPRIVNGIKKKFKDSLNRNHYQTSRMNLVKVWQVDVEKMSKAFDDYGRKLGNIKELYHGSSASNLLSILKVGLKTSPPTSAHITGKMFGPGIYASSQSSKALNYATSFWGQSDLGRYFMFLVEFAMGKMYIPTSYSSVRYPVKGYDSTFAKAGQSGVQNNEEIVYNDNQANLKYLCEFS